jgi:hypothetical protein
MRASGWISFLAVLLLAASASRAASTSSLTLPPSVPAPDDWTAPQFPKLTATAPVLTPTAQMNADAFIPKNLLLSPATFPPPEASTPAQLEARLAAYVGTWRGESTWFSAGTGKIIRFPTEMTYRFVQLNARRVLACAITYTINGAATVTHERLWVENGRIVSEVIENGQPQQYLAHTDHENLVWQTMGSIETAFDFGETETLRLTADGGQITTSGFEVDHTPDGDVFVHESSVLKLVK